METIIGFAAIGAMWFYMGWIVGTRHPKKGAPQMEYEYLTPEAQKAMLQARLLQLETEHFGHSMNRASAADDPEKVAAAEEAMASNDKYYAEAKAELESLKDSSVEVKK